MCSGFPNSCLLFAAVTAVKAVIASSQMDIPKPMIDFQIDRMVDDFEFLDNKADGEKTETKSKDVTDFLDIPDGLVETLPFS